MRIWNKYYLKKQESNELSIQEYTAYQLKISKELDDKNFDFNNFNKSFNKETYNYLIDKLYGDCLSIGSGKGHLEYHLSKKHNITATDINKDFIKYNDKINFKFFDIVNSSEEGFKILGKFDCIFVPSLIYAFNDDQLNIFFSNLKKLIKNDGNIYVFFRSRDSFITNIIDNILIPCEEHIKKVFYKVFMKKDLYVAKSQQGYRRSLDDLKKIVFANNLSIKSVEYSMFETDYNRLSIIKKLKLGKLISLIFLKRHPNMNIFHLKKK